MKKILLFAVLLATFTVARSQEDFKHAGGDIILEVNAAPFSASPISINSLKGRFYLSENLVARLGLSIKSMSKNSVDNSDEDNPVENSESMFSFGLQPGVEMHRAITDRFNTYVGGELIFSMQSASTETKVGDTVTELDGKGMGTRKGTAFGLNAVLGADYYIVKKIYIGAEIGFGFIYESFPELKSGDPVVVTDIEESRFGLGFNYNSMFRIGFKF